MFFYAILLEREIRNGGDSVESLFLCLETWLWLEWSRGNVTETGMPSGK